MNYCLSEFREFFRWEHYKRIFKWVPVLWRNCEWDYAFLLIVMQFKIRNMREAFEEYDFHEGKDEVIAQMKRAEELLTRLIKGEYWSDFGEEGYSYERGNELERKDREELFDLLKNSMTNSEKGWWY